MNKMSFTSHGRKSTYICILFTINNMMPWCMQQGRLQPPSTFQARRYGVAGSPHPLQLLTEIEQKNYTWVTPTLEGLASPNTKKSYLRAWLH